MPVTLQLARPFRGKKSVWGVCTQNFLGTRKKTPESRRTTIPGSKRGDGKKSPITKNDRGRRWTLTAWI